MRTTTKLLVLALTATAAGIAVAADPMPAPPTQYPPGELGEMVKLGEDIIMHTNTHPLTKDFVGNKLTCASCHIDGGKTHTIGTFIGTATVFPAYSGREKTVQTLQDRINNCFMRSMNGIRPIIDTKASVAMAAYVTWLSDGMPIKTSQGKPVTPLFATTWPDKDVGPLIKAATHENYLRGQKLYADRCAACHGTDGQGNAAFPPLWGKDTYNTGAGMSKLPQMSGWVVQNMPKGDANLTKQQAVDVTIYVDAQPHPDFDLKAHLLPASEMGYYNSAVLDEKSSVRANFKAMGLDIDAIRGDHLIK
ncbi:MAG TPA: c-type cytochrome [Parasulfuritortus sp.]